MDTNHNDTVIFATDSLYTATDSATMASAPPARCSIEAVYGNGSILVAPAGDAAEPQERDAFSLSGGFLALSIIFLFLIFSRYIHSFLGLLSSSMFSYRRLEKHYKENSLFVVITTRIMLIFTVISISFGCWLVWPVHLAWSEEGVHAPLYVFAILFVGTVSVLLLKILLLHAIEYVGRSKDVMQSILYFGQFYLIAYGFSIFPVSLLMVVTPYGPVFNILIIINFAITVIFLLLYFFRIIQILHHAHISIFFLILYLCTLEISPLIVLYGFLSTS
ncbi:MAG: DUF4271 domain-containing protein [Prevotellaceae bacterium]|nr:DUF4271 domain-containing protein [Prevotellaceae bacterium]